LVCAITTPLACCQSVGLDHDRSVEVRQRVLQLFFLGADGVMRRRDPMPLHEFLGETLARLQLRRCFGWSEDRPSAALEFVHHAQSQGQLGPDNSDIGIQSASQLDHRVEALEIDGHALGIAGNPATAGAQYSFLMRGDCRSFHAIACSRPPPRGRVPS